MMMAGSALAVVLPGMDSFAPRHVASVGARHRIRPIQLSRLFVLGVRPGGQTVG